MVDHTILFRKFVDLCLLFTCCYVGVRWGSFVSESFCVSNGVQQGSVLSPFLFAVYLDGLLSELSDSGVGCYWGNLFVVLCVMLTILLCFTNPLLEVSQMCQYS